MKSDDYFNFPIKCYNFLYIGPSTESKFKYISTYVTLLLLITLHLMILYEFTLIEHGDIIKMSQNFESIATFAQLLVRKLLLLRHGDLMGTVVGECQNFLNYDTLGGKLGNIFRKMVARWALVIKYHVSLGVILCTLFSLTPVFVKTVELPHPTWLPFRHPYFVAFVYAMELYFYAEMLITAWAFDGCFLFMCVNIRVQFKILSAQLTGVFKRGPKFEFVESEKIMLKNLSDFTERHISLTRIYKKINEIYSVFFVCQYLINISAFCVQFFVIVNESSTITQVLRGTAYIVSLFIEAALIFFPASDVEEEAENYSTQIYNLPWYEVESGKVKKQILFMLMQSQVPLRLSGEGFFYLNKNAFLLIPRQGFSLSTLLKNIV